MSLFSAPTRSLSFAEMIALLAALMSMMAFSIDSILPALPEIAGEMGLTDPSRAQLTIAAFVLGTGIGQFFFGPLSDSYGRRPALVLGVGLYVIGALAGWRAGSLEALLGARAVQGLGAAAPRIIAQAVTRDLFSGRDQARVGSLIFAFFVIIPALAPLFGQEIINLFGWRGLFVVYVILGLGVLTWFLTRQRETLAPENRRPFRLRPVLTAVVEVTRTPVAMRYLAVMTLGFGQLIAYISSAQQVYVDALGAGRMFPVYFAVVALISAGSGVLNSRLVMRLGMRKLASWAFGSQVVFATLLWLLWHSGVLDGLAPPVRLAVFILWSVTLFFMNGLIFGNVTAMAMEPLGHIAGTASAVMGALSTAAAMVIAVPIGLAFDGTPRPLMLGAAICSALAFWLVWSDRKRERAAGQPV